MHFIYSPSESASSTSYLQVIIELFSLVLTVETLIAEICQSAFFEGVGHGVLILGGRGHRPPTSVGVRKLE